MQTLDLDTGVGHWLDVWKASRANASPHRRRADEARIDKYILPKFGRRSAARLTREQVETWVDELLAEEVGAPTVYAVVMILRQALNMALDEGVIRDNPVKGVRVSGVTTIREPEPDEVLTPKQVKAILDGIDPFYRPLIHLCLVTGARWEEALGLRVEDLFLREGMATIGRYRVVEQGGNVVTQEGSHRLVELTADLVEELREYINETKDWRSKDWNWVFLTKRARRHPLRPNFNIHVWRPALRAAGLDDRSVKFHALRHTAAVRMIEAGLTSEEVAERLGIGNPKVVRRMYKHWFEARDKANKRPMA